MITIRDIEVSRRIITRLKAERSAVWKEMERWKEKGGMRAYDILKSEHQAYGVAIRIVTEETR